MESPEWKTIRASEIFCTVKWRNIPILNFCIGFYPKFFRNFSKNLSQFIHFQCNNILLDIV